jgi:site-specific DNA-methyltransferase (adenine-specific)
LTPLLTAFTAAPEKNKVYNLDLFALCAALPAASVDMILCDLPYGTTACAWDTIIPFDAMWKVFKRIIKLSGAIVLTADQPFTSALLMSNPKMYRHRWVWDKNNSAGFLNANIKPLSTVEDVLVFSSQSVNYFPEMEIRGKPRNKGRSTPSDVYGKTLPTASYNNTYFPKAILRFPNASHVDRLHPTQKPVDLFRYLIRTYTEVGQVVFDPCVGSGTTAIAAREEGRSFIVGDSSLEYVEIARARLAAPYTPSFMPQLDLTA